VSVARRIGANMIAALVGKVAVALAGLLTVAIMTRHLDAANYGILKTAQTFVLFVGTLADLGLQIVVLREVAVAEDRARRIIGSALAARMAFSAVFLALGCAAATFAPWSPTVLFAIAIAAVGMVAYQGNEIITAVLQWRLSQGRVMVAEVVGTLAVLLGAAVTAYLGLGVLTMTAMSSFGLVVAFLLAWYLASRLTAVPVLFDAREWRRLIGQGLPIGASFYLLTIALRGDVLLLSLLKPSEDVGLYGVASKIYEVGLQLPIIFGALLLPMFARSAGDPPQLRAQLAQSLHVMVIVGMGIVIGLGFYASEIVSLLAGPHFSRAAAAVRVAGASVALGGIAHVLRHVAMAQARQRQMLRADVAITAFAICAYLILIPRMSFVGAAWATMITEVVAIACLLFVVRAGLDKLPWSWQTIRALVAGVVTTAAVLLLRRAGLPVLLDAALATLIYCGLLLLTRALDVAQLRALLASKPPAP
jgi:O-antigen/teichoic acid export membrane protein